MRKAVCTALLATAVIASQMPYVRAEEEFSEVEYYRQLAEKQLAEPAPAPPAPARYAVGCGDARANALMAIPRHYHSRSGDARFSYNGTDMNMSESRANGAGVSVTYTRRVTDRFSFGVLYDYAFLDVKGGFALPGAVVAAATSVREDSRWESHTVGVLPRFDIAGFGTFELGLTHSFDRADGYEQVDAVRRDVDGRKMDTTSAIAWWEKDFAVGCTGWAFSPYAGWRSMYSATKGRNDWLTGNKSDDDFWTHSASAGVKASFESGRFGVSFRGGVSRRVNSDGTALFGNRAVAPGAMQFSHRANLDRTAGAVGAELRYRLNDCATLGVGYDGMFGKDTSAHAGSVKFGLSF